PFPPPGEVAFDLIACRNVLIYFEPKTVEGVITGLESALRTGGQILLGSADRLAGTAARSSSSRPQRQPQVRRGGPDPRRRRAIYVDPRFGLAAFELGRAQDALGVGRAAARAYAQALRVLDPDDDRHATILGQVDVGDVAAACRARLGQDSSRERKAR